jgi:hypothetical protein
MGASMQNTSAIQALLDNVRLNARTLGLMPEIRRVPRAVPPPAIKPHDQEKINWDLLNPVEEDEQQALFQWLDEHEDSRLKLAFAVPNGGKRSFREGKAQKLAGLKAGVPDIFIPIRTEEYGGMFVEMKRRKNGSLRANQRQWIADLNEQGYFAVVAKGWHDAASKISLYLQTNA